MIARFLKTQEIKKRYNGREINKHHRWEATPGCDYVVVSIEILIEREKDSEESIRYWIVNDKENLLPYDAYNFKIIDSYFPSTWIVDIARGGIEFSHPKWAQYGYVEDYFDEIKVEKEYNKIIKTIFDESVEAALKKGIKLNLGIKKLWTQRLSD